MADEPDNRSLAQFFFEVGYGACLADAMVRNDMKPPFDLTDEIVEHAWQIAGEAYETPAEFDAKLAMTNAAPELYGALESWDRVHAEMIAHKAHEAEAVPELIERWAKLQIDAMEKTSSALSKARGETPSTLNMEGDGRG